MMNAEEDPHPAPLPTDREHTIERYSLAAAFLPPVGEGDDNALWEMCEEEFKTENAPCFHTGRFQNKLWQRPTLPYRYQYSTIGAGELNFRVRNGNGCFLLAIVTRIQSKL